uniref:Uncharacterized protein n=1 Tax=Caulerpa cliftonii TaxID=1004391 RepID=A0A1C9JBS2_9CHLO|nr:hypothetical protein [Caulerpa cliftonii]AOP19296.1 hypothetical protein [Caulerpa cliftonii]
MITILSFACSFVTVIYPTAAFIRYVTKPKITLKSLVQVQNLELEMIVEHQDIRLPNNPVELNWEHTSDDGGLYEDGGYDNPFFQHIKISIRDNLEKNFFQGNESYAYRTRVCDLYTRFYVHKLGIAQFNSCFANHYLNLISDNFFNSLVSEMFLIKTGIANVSWSREAVEDIANVLNVVPTVARHVRAFDSIEKRGLDPTAGLYYYNESPTLWNEANFATVVSSPMSVDSQKQLTGEIQTQYREIIQHIPCNNAHIISGIIANGSAPISLWALIITIALGLFFILKKKLWGRRSTIRAKRAIQMEQVELVFPEFYPKEEGDTEIQLFTQQKYRNNVARH